MMPRFLARSLSLFSTWALPAVASAQGLSFGLADGNDGWPSDKHDAIQSAMTEAVAIYNSQAFCDKHDTANYNPGVPTAQSNYDGWIDFGGSINTRVALHETAHTLGIGTYWGFNGGAWNEDSAAGRLIKLYEGQAAILSTGGTHFWPYGLNYDNEDNPEARIRHVRLVSAFRFDMGIVTDSDTDGLRDDWETHFFGGLDQAADGDPDSDGIRNADEQASDGDPTRACPLTDGVTYVLRGQISDRAVTATALTSGAATQQHTPDGSTVQQWTAHYVGGGFFQLVNVASGKRLEVPGTDTASAIPVQLGDDAKALRQEWRVTDGPGAKDGYYALSNHETARVLDGLDGNEGTPLEQYPLLGNIPQQYWRFEHVGTNGGAPDAAGDTDAGDAGGPGADVDAGRDATQAPPSDGGAGPAVDGQVGATAPGPVHEPAHSHGGCSVGGSANAAGAAAYGLILAFWALRRRRTS